MHSKTKTRLKGTHDRNTTNLGLNKGGGFTKTSGIQGLRWGEETGYPGGRPLPQSWVGVTLVVTQTTDTPETTT